MHIIPLLCWIIFIVHWIMICPLVWALLYKTNYSNDWPNSWHYYFWIVAFLVWLMIMAILFLIWRWDKNREAARLTAGIFVKSSPNFNTDLKPVQPNIHQERSSMKQRDSDNFWGEGSSEEVTLRKPRKKLSPLIIHRNMLGEKNEASGVIDIEMEDRISIIDSDTESMKKYLQIVPAQTPISPEPLDGDERKSAKSPMSPRELFFIDLIRDAENSDEPALRKSAHFPENKSLNKERDEDDKSYFIANVTKSVNQKSEIFIDVSPEVRATDKNRGFKWTVDKRTSKPELTLSSDAKEEL